MQKKNSKGKIITMVCFDMTAKIKDMLIKGMCMKTIKIAHLYYDLMNYYSEQNVLALKTAIEYAGFKVNIFYRLMMKLF